MAESQKTKTAEQVTGQRSVGPDGPGVIEKGKEPRNTGYGRLLRTRLVHVSKLALRGRQKSLLRPSA